MQKVQKSKLMVSQALSTLLTAEKVERIAEECAVQLTLVEARFCKDRKWINDFEIEGEPGKVEAFFVRIKDIEIQ